MAAGQQARFLNQGDAKYDEGDVYTGRQSVDDDLDGEQLAEPCVVGEEPMGIEGAEDS